MGLLDKAKVGFKYSQWKRDLHQWTDYYFIRTRCTPFVSATFMQPSADDPKMMQVMTMTIARREGENYESFYEFFLNRFTNLASDIGIEKESFEFPKFKQEDFDQAIQELEDYRSQRLLYETPAMSVSSSNQLFII